MEPAIANKADQQIDAKAPASSASGPSHISPFPHPTNATKPPKKPRSRRKAAETEEEDDDTKRRCVSTACVACRLTPLGTLQATQVQMRRQPTGMCGMLSSVRH
ncbi:hypothetical protein KC324_g9888 [Hortaea werneckii]|nr:hypothetical protein KC324_g9888 [Hortaea werneckii]